MEQMTKRTLNTVIWEGWTIQNFIDSMISQFLIIMNGESWKKTFQTEDEVRQWCKDNQPYYKKEIPEVTAHFWDVAQKYIKRGEY